jgi:hypothetical protein
MKALRTAALAALLALALCAPAGARDPGRWTLRGWSSVSNQYWQGVTSAGPSAPLYFSGFTEGLYRTTRTLRETRAISPVVPASVKAVEGYNHVGDISFDGADGKRVLLPLECHTPGGPNGGNTCGTGAIGTADPETLAFRYYVKLDPSEIAKAMWVEASPDGFLWTSSGNDLLAYRAADVSPAKASPASPPIHSVRRLAGAVPPSGVTGAAFRGGRLFLAGAQGTTFQVWSVNLASGRRRLELELKSVQGEAEGLHVTSLLGGTLHFLIAPLAQKPSFPPTVALLHFAHATGRHGLRVIARASRQGGRRPRVRVRVMRRGEPVEGATVSVAGKRARTNANGRATLKPVLDAPGRFAALGRKGPSAGRSRFLPLGKALGGASSAAASVPLR